MVHKIKWVMIITLCVLAFSFKSYGQNCPDPAVTSCYDLECENLGAWTISTKVIYLPDWPNCPITVQYAWRQCSSSPFYVVQMSICNFLIFCNSDCMPLCTYAVFSGNTWHNTQYISQQIQNELTKENFQTMWNSLTQDEKNQYACPDGPSQNDPNANNWRVKYFFMQSTCQGWCRTLTSEGGNDKITLTPINCIENSCCKVKIMYCVIDPYANPVQLRFLKYYEDMSGQSCEATPFPTELCPDGIEVTHIDCKSSCQEFTKDN